MDKKFIWLQWRGMSSEEGLGEGEGASKAIINEAPDMLPRNDQDNGIRWHLEKLRYFTGLVTLRWMEMQE